MCVWARARFVVYWEKPTVYRLCSGGLRSLYSADEISCVEELC